MGTKHAQKDPNKIGDGWGWMSTQTQTQKKWELIKWAAEIAKLHVKVKRPGKLWEAEAKPRVKVGF